MAKKIEVQVVGDAKSFQKAMGTAGKATDGFGSSMAKVGKIAAVGLVAGVGAAAYAATKFAQAAIEAEKSQTRLSTAFDHVKASASQQTAAMDAVNKVMNQSGLDDEDLSDSLARLTTVTGDVTKAQRDMGIAADVARARGVDLAAATAIVSKAELGNVGALKRIGIEIPKVTTAQDALKASHVKATQAQKDAAKSADDLATRQSAIAALQTKFGGAAEKYGQTAAGAMDRFKVSIQNVEEGLGAALLPAVTAVAGGLATFINRFNEAESAGAKFHVVMDALQTVAGKAWDALRAGFAAINWAQVWDVVSGKAREGVSKVASSIASFVRGIDWSVVGDAVGSALVRALSKLNAFIRSVDWAAVTRAMIDGFKKVVVAFGQFLVSVDWGAVIGKMFHLIVAVIKGLATVMLTVAAVLGKAILQGVWDGAKALWGDFAAWLGTRPAKIKGAFSGAGKWLYNAGLAILQGLWDGLKDKWHDVEHWLAGLKDKIPHIKGPIEDDKVLLTPAGVAIINGLLVGMQKSWPSVAAFLSSRAGSIATALAATANAVTSQMAVLQGKLDVINARRESQDRASAVREAAAALVEAKKKGEGVAAAEQALQRAREDIVTAGISNRLTKEQGYLDKLNAAMDKVKAAIETKRTALQTVWAGLTDDILSAFDGLAAKIQTPAEKALAALEKLHTESGLSDAVAQAQADLSTAQASGDPNEVAAAQKALDDAQYNQLVYGLGQQAAAERTSLDQRQADRRTNLATSLTDLEKSFEDHKISWNTFNTQLQKILKSYGVDYKSAGAVMGQSFAQGLRSALNDVKAAARDLAAAGAGQPVSSASGSGGAGDPFFGGFQKMASGGIVKARAGGTLALLGEAGRDEAVIPLGAGGGVGTTINVTVNGAVGSPAEIANVIRTELLRVSRRNGNLGLS